MEIQPNDKVVCLSEFDTENPDYLHPNGAPPVGPALCVDSMNGPEGVKIVGYPVYNWGQKDLPPREVGYSVLGFRKIEPLNRKKI